MPTLSIFYGIIIRMLAEQGVNHNTPHIHAKYNDYEVSVAFDGTVLGGDFPPKQMKLLQAWIAIHEDDLRANWETLNESGTFFKIEPLR
ncbi:MAG: DUF4160 domain-containing protein [Clostridia bacterium]|nr:DUF4160 domain-containing protein [Clostridia bacterium]